MKRILSLSLVLLMALGFATNAAAQSFDWGITAGLNLTKLKIKGDKGDFANNLKTDNQAGWFVGPKIAFNTVIGLGVDASAQYSLRNLEIGGETEKYHTIEIPINVRYNIGLGKKLGVYVATGPQFGFALGNMSWDNFATGTNFSKSNLNTTWNIGAGLRLLNHLEIGVGYNFAMSKAGKAIFEGVGGATGESNDYQLEYRTNTFQVQATYFF